MSECRIARVIDFETTGTQDDDDPEIVEFGSVDVAIESRVLIWKSHYSSLARPRKPIPPQSMAVHHILDADVAEFPPAREQWDMFLDGVTDADVFVAHNARFEQFFMPERPNPWICTYKVARIVWPDAPGHSNQCLRYWLALAIGDERAYPPHRALPDAFVTAQIFIELLKRKTIAEMVAISQYPALLKVMNFGKHKGMTFADAPLDYLEWIRDKSDMDEDRKFTAHYWIKKRS